MAFVAEGTEYAVVETVVLKVHGDVGGAGDAGALVDIVGRSNKWAACVPKRAVTEKRFVVM